MPDFLTAKVAGLAVWTWAAIAAGALALARARARARAAQPPGGGGPATGGGDQMAGPYRRMLGNVFADNGLLGLPLDAHPSSPSTQPPIVYDPAQQSASASPAGEPSSAPADSGVAFADTPADAPSPTPTSRPPSSSGEIQSSSFSPARGDYSQPPAAFTYSPPANPPSSYTITGTFGPATSSPAPAPTIETNVFRVPGGGGLRVS